MISIEKIKIERFRSILKLELSIDTSFNLVSICGQNNVGKTNTLRAINLFFNPEEYDIFLDRPVLKQAQGGASIDPTITITFFNSDNSFYYEISRSLKEYEENKQFSGLKGCKYEKKNTQKISNVELKNDEISSLLKEIRFRYIESINIDIPNLIEDLTENIIDVEYTKTRLSKTKKELYNAYKKYTEGLQEILDIFSDKISETFNNFKSEWDIKFHVPSSVQTFRDLISNDVELRIDDGGGFNTEQKGSGLQRLAVILLNFEILKRMEDKSHIICIDEPDIYLHQGLQKKLKNFFEKNFEKIQIFYTTHSEIFIDSNLLRNVKLLDAEIEKKWSTRKNKEIDVVKTKEIKLDIDEGYDKICEHLGIEKIDLKELERENILVEGNCDKKYLEGLGQYFRLKIPKIISMDGISNVEKYLYYYSSYYSSNNKGFKPKIKVLFDNDNAGRKQFNQIKNKKYQELDIDMVLLKNYLGNSEEKNINHEIEDFIYPEIIVYLTNEILKNINLELISQEEVDKKLSASKSLSSKGILEFIEYKKNDNNPENGNIIVLNTPSHKKNMAEKFNLEDKEISNIIKENRNKYPFVEEFIRDLFNFTKENKKYK